jgi:pyrroloquinoline quinone (PQQ) biosynthesis protein C
VSAQNAGRVDRCDLESLMVEVSRAGHPADFEWLWAELALLRERWDVLRHPFHRRWSEGRLTRGELQVYASEYDHVVVAIARASRRAAELSGGLVGEALADHADHERDHVDWWRAFAVGTGWCHSSAWYFGEDPFPETIACAKTIGGTPARSLAEHLVTLYAVESAQSRIAQVELDGLVGHYGFDGGPSTEYFRLHAGHDAEHGALAQAALQPLLGRDDPFVLLRQAEAVHRACWALLDGLDEQLGS